MSHPTNEQEMARLAKSVRQLADLIESSGMRALAVTESWMLGPRSPNLDPDAGGWVYENCGPKGQKGCDECPHPKPVDSTGEAAMSDDDDLEGEHARYTRLLASLADDVPELIGVLRKAVPSALAVLRPDDLSNAQVSAQGWCVSCWRDGTYHEPVALQPNGERRYRDLCLWCGRFMAANDGRMPPLELVEARHRGDRITQQSIDTAFAREEEDRKKRKAERKGRAA